MPQGKALGVQYETCWNPVKGKESCILGIRPSHKFCKLKPVVAAAVNDMGHLTRCDSESILKLTRPVPI